MGRPIVVISDPIHRDGVELLEKSCAVRCFANSYEEKDAIYEAMLDADAVIVRALKVPGELMQRCGNLKIIAKHGSGVNNIDVEAATACGVVVTNTGAANSTAVAEAAMALMLSALRLGPAMDRLVREGRFEERWGLIAGEITGRSVGLVGFGKIGRQVGKMCHGGFGAEVIAYDPVVGAAEMAEAGARKVERLDDLMAMADIVSVHAPLTAGTRHMIGAGQLAAMKRTGVLVHTSRGGVVDEAALTEALAAGRIFAAGLDVFEAEPPAADNPLFSLPNVVLSPHIGGATESSRSLAATQAADAVLSVLEGREPAYFVNATVWNSRRNAA